MYVGKKVTRVDAHDKAMGRTRYTDDLCDKSAYVIRILHSTIANGRVISIDTSEAEKIPGVVKIFTCFDLKEKHYYPTAGHPWSTDPVSYTHLTTTSVCLAGSAAPSWPTVFTPGRRRFSG